MSSEETTARHLRRLLADLKASQELERQAFRRREAARSLAVRVADELNGAEVTPSLRAFAAELERQGHLTRLERLAAGATKLHVQVQGRRIVEATVELDWRVEEELRLRARVRQHFQDVAVEELPAAEIDGRRLAELWVRLLERLVALANR